MDPLSPFKHILIGFSAARPWHLPFLLERVNTVWLVLIWPSAIDIWSLPPVHRSFFLRHHYEYNQYIVIGLTRSNCIPRYNQHFPSYLLLSNYLDICSLVSCLIQMHPYWRMSMPVLTIKAFGQKVSLIALPKMPFQTGNKYNVIIHMFQAIQLPLSAWTFRIVSVFPAIVNPTTPGNT